MGNNLLKAREGACDQVVLDFTFASDWLRDWREFFRPIITLSEVKQKYSNPVLLLNPIESCSYQFSSC